jgi:hypothetical protein
LGTRASVRGSAEKARVEPKEPSNYVITPEDDIGGGTPTEKYSRNITAIRVLRIIGAERREATPEEKRTLVRYVGWGGMKNAFNPDNESWK